MGLRELAETDLTAILNDTESGFGFPITITDPAGVSSVDPLNGFSNDIGQVIDPDTGTAVSGRNASVSLSISDLTKAGFTLPVGVSDKSSKPWLIQFNDINGNSFLFKINETLPDRAIGLVVCILEAYENG